MRSVCWTGKNVYAGTKNSEILLISNDNKQHPKVLVQVSDMRGTRSRTALITTKGPTCYPSLISTGSP